MRRPSRILIIDDNEADLHLLKVAIAETGWNAEIVEASSGRRAVDMLRMQPYMQEPPDLLLVDHILTGETCIDVVPKIRALSGYESIPVIVMSSTKPTEADRQKIYAVGALKILVKAHDYQSLLKIVQTLRRMLTKKGNISQGGSWITDSDLAMLGDG